jgi:metallo-beta-lactamase family protein
MNISFHGAAQTVTGSKHILHLQNGKKILLDCGMFQGLGKDTLRLNQEWGFDPSSISLVLLSHAHIDHSGLLPKLVKDGFKGSIYCTTATADLVKLMLIDSAHIQENDVKHINKRRLRDERPLVEPLYTSEDAEKVFERLVPVKYNELLKIDDQISIIFSDCGHILGSAAINIRIEEEGRTKSICFSGDVGRYRDMILRAPDVFPQADYIIMESTYGNKLHEEHIPSVERFLDILTDTCLKRKGKLIIPAFSIGRTQELLYLLNRLELEHRLPKLDYFVDSPLSIHATAIIKNHPECFNSHVQDLLKKDDDVFGFKGLHLIEKAEDSIRLNDYEGPCVIISASGMAEAGRIKHHIAHHIESSKNTILIVGFSESHSLAGKLKLDPKEVKIFGEPYQVNASIETIDSMSAHGDYQDLLKWLSCQDVSKVERFFLVHGEYENQIAMQKRLQQKGFKNVVIPKMHEEISL